MPQTPASSATPYCTGPQFFQFVAFQLAADMLRAQPESPRPSYLAMIDPANPAGQRLLVFLMRGAGEIESACAIAARYSVLDLQALTGASAAMLQSLNAARALWFMFQKLQPGTAQPDRVPGATESAALLEALREGKRIFTFTETIDAGLPSVNPPMPNQLVTGYLIGRASRLFPGYGATGINSGVGFGNADN